MKAPAGHDIIPVRKGGAIAPRWFEVMRRCGDDVRELLHDVQPTACVGDAAFGYVDVFTHHVNVRFFRARSWMIWRARASSCVT
jgi:hypothetical protein